MPYTASEFLTPVQPQHNNKAPGPAVSFGRPGAGGYYLFQPSIFRGKAMCTQIIETDIQRHPINLAQVTYIFDDILLFRFPIR